MKREFETELEDYLRDPSLVEWEKLVNQSLINHRRQQEKHRDQHQLDYLLTDTLFHREKGNSRYTVKADKIVELNTYPWLLLPPRTGGNRYRETIFTRNDENIEDVTNAINYFRNIILDEGDYTTLREIYLNQGRPQRNLWAIVELRKVFEKERVLRQSRDSQRALANRLAQAEREIAMIFSTQNSPNHLRFPDQNSSDLSMLQRLEYLEKLVNDAANQQA